MSTQAVTFTAVADSTPDLTNGDGDTYYIVNGGKIAASGAVGLGTFHLTAVFTSSVPADVEIQKSMTGKIYQFSVTGDTNGKVYAANYSGKATSAAATSVTFYVYVHSYSSLIVLASKPNSTAITNDLKAENPTLIEASATIGKFGISNTSESTESSTTASLAVSVGNSGNPVDPAS